MAVRSLFGRPVAVVVALLVLSTFVAISSFCYSAGAVLAVRNAPLALKFSSSNPLALAMQATLDSREAVQPGANFDVLRARALLTARKAIQLEAYNVTALRALAFATATQGDDGQSTQQLEVAERLSRRELGVQIALSEYCVARNDVACALRHYARALATQEEAMSILAPRLIAALEEIEIREKFAPYLRRRARWTAEIATYGAQNSKNPTWFADTVIRAGGLPPGDDYEEARGLSISRLVDGGYYREARRLYLTIEKGRGSPLIDPAFPRRERTARRAPLEWQSLGSESGTAAFEPSSGQSQRLFASAQPGAKVVAARKLLYLRPGAYALIAKIGELNIDAGGAALIRFRCLSPDAVEPFAQVAPLQLGPLAKRIVIPANCTVQLIDVLMYGGSRSEGASMIIESMSLRLATAASAELPA